MRTEGYREIRGDLDERMDFDDFNVLSEMEERICVEVGWERRSGNRRKGRIDKKYSLKEGHLLDIQAVGSELMFCKLLNLFPELSCEYKWGMKDCFLQDGRSVDVKMRMGYNEIRSLEVPAEMEKKSADIYALMIGKMPVYKFSGWAYGKDVFACGKEVIREVHNLNPGKRRDRFFHIEHDELREPRELLEIIKGGR